MAGAADFFKHEQRLQGRNIRLLETTPGESSGIEESAALLEADISLEASWLIPLICCEEDSKEEFSSGVSL